MSITSASGEVVNQPATASGNIRYDQKAAPTSASSPQWADLSNRVAGIRDEARFLGEDAEELHRAIQHYDLNERAALKSRQGHIALLGELSDKRGMGWSDIALAVGVSLSGVRKWRKGGDCSPDNRIELSRLSAILDLADEAMVVDPAGWLLTPVLPGYTIRHIDLIASGRADLVLDCAFQMKTPTAVLDEFDPEWRETYRRQFDIIDDEDGIRSLRRRA